MTFKIRHGDYSQEHGRKRMAEVLSRIIDALGSAEVPYMPNRGDHSYWTLDQGNDWKVKFLEDRPDCIRVTYRYQCEGNPYEEALAEWLKVRLGAVVVE